MKKNTVLIVMILLSSIMLGVLIYFVMGPVIRERNAASATTETTQSTTAATETQPTETEPPYVPEIHPDTIGLYIPAADGTKDRVKVTEFTSAWEAKKDIDCFEAFASADDRIAGTSFAEMWKTVWNGHDNTENAKIAYMLSIELNDGSVIDRIIMKPADAEDFREYLEVYLYDDINQTPGVRYTHLSDTEINNDTILSSIKLTCGSRIDEVQGIQLTAFIYNGDDCFAADGSYLGKVMATIEIREG